MGPIELNAHAEDMQSGGEQPSLLENMSDGRAPNSQVIPQLKNMLSSSMIASSLDTYP